ncbi:hypothetical protein EV567_0635 [Streptomyces sp. BK239]|nr:hypothetical protein EV567_0635 [Streptomyces sp. BK239]
MAPFTSCGRMWVFCRRDSEPVPVQVSGGLDVCMASDMSD